MKTILSYLLASLLLAWSSSSGATELQLLPLVPDHVGLTTSRAPSLCWILWGIPPDRVTLRFTLITNQSITPLLEVDLPSSFLTDNKEACQCVDLKDYGIVLEPSVQYRWYISLARSHESRSYPREESFVGGMVERCDFNKCILDFDRCDRDALKSFAQRGLWYDSISCLCNLIKSNPTDTTLRQLMFSLMNDAGGLQKTPSGLQDPYLIPLK